MEMIRMIGKLQTETVILRSSRFWREKTM